MIKKNLLALLEAIQRKTKQVIEKFYQSNTYEKLIEFFPFLKKVHKGYAIFKSSSLSELKNDLKIRDSFFFLEKKTSEKENKFSRFVDELSIWRYLVYVILFIIIFFHLYLFVHMEKYKWFLNYDSIIHAVTIYDQVGPLSNFFGEQQLILCYTYINQTPISFIWMLLHQRESYWRNEDFAKSTIDLLMTDLLVLFIFIIIAFGISIVFFTLNYALGNYNEQNDGEKISSYECGFEPFEDARNAFNIQFYLVSILFIVFDLELTYIFPWSVVVFYDSWFGFWMMMNFIVILTIGFYVEYKRGALEWD